MGRWEDGNQDGDEDERMWGGGSFIPTYVYDALKEKRFDNMRVSVWAKDDLLVLILQGGQQEDAEEVLGFLLETLLVLLREEVTGRWLACASSPSGPVEAKEEAARPTRTR